MAVMLSRQQYQKLMVLVTQMQALIHEISEKGAIQNEVIDILQNTEVARKNPELTTHVPVIKSKVDINNREIDEIWVIKNQLNKMRNGAQEEGFDSVIERQKELIIKNFVKIKALFFEKRENFCLQQDIEVFEAVEVNGMPISLAAQKFNFTENDVHYILSKIRVKIVSFLLKYES